MFPWTLFSNSNTAVTGPAKTYGEVNRQWPMLASATTLEDLMLELRKKLFAKKAKELKDAGIDRAETKL